MPFYKDSFNGKEYRININHVKTANVSLCNLKIDVSHVGVNEYWLIFNDEQKYCLDRDCIKELEFIINALTTSDKVG